MHIDKRRRYGFVSRLLHWSIAVLMIGLLWLGWYVVDLSYYDRWFTTFLNWHKALGMLVLAAGLANIPWAFASPAPAPPASIASWERLGTRAMHLTLFAMVLAIPITGYIISTSAGGGISIFGWFEVPALLAKNDTLRDLAVDLHFYLAYITAALVLLHASAALKHQFVDRDGTLRRML